MACLEYDCRNASCNWRDITNALITKCPKCGSAVNTLFDEPIDRSEDVSYSDIPGDGDEFEDDDV